MEYKMNMDELADMLARKIADAAYRARITEHLHDIGFDQFNIGQESASMSDHAFAWMETLNVITGTEKGDLIYHAARCDAAGDIQKITNEQPGKRERVVALLSAAGYDGEVISNALARAYGED